MSAATIGILTNFDHSGQDWKTYKSRLNQYFIANDIDAAEDATGTKKRAILLSALSESTYKLAANLALPKDVANVPYEDILILLDKHFTPVSVGFGERHNFYAATQQPGESHTDWAARLRGLTAQCDFANVGEALRDRFMMGMLPCLEKEKLYAEQLKDLTLARAVELAETLRCARAGAGSNTDQLFKISKDKDKVQCTVCGYNNHKASECRFAKYVCKKCKVKGHLRRMCTKVKYVGRDADNEGDDDDGKLYNIRSLRGEPMVESVTIRGAKFKFEIDSGSAVTVISQNTYDKSFSDIPLLPANKKLQSYTGDKIKCIGMIPLPIAFAGMTHSLNVHVVCDGGPPLLGRDFISLFKYTRLVFGLASAPAVFQRAMEGLLAGMDGVLCLLDDVLITGRDAQEHLQRLHAVLRRLQDAGLTLQKEKCVFFQDEVSYLGYLINKDGSSTGSFQPNLKIIVTVDASPTGLGAILSQVDDEGCERPVSFASRSLNAAEKRYSQIQKEATAIIFGTSANSADYLSRACLPPPTGAGVVRGAGAAALTHAPTRAPMKIEHRIDESIEKMIGACEVCIQLRPAPARAPLAHWPLPPRPFHRKCQRQIDLQHHHYRRRRRAPPRAAPLPRAATATPGHRCHNNRKRKLPPQHGASSDVNSYCREDEGKMKSLNSGGEFASSRTIWCIVIKVKMTMTNFMRQ
ncbi:uncharacterized protein [Choristoneura fumiferana]|uniref:uncharacterized protein n=1 Tax=Choristoneura fumiferana TaxID=7141 RepID=UPI003D15F0AE